MLQKETVLLFLFPQFVRTQQLPGPQPGTERHSSVAANRAGTWLGNFQRPQESHGRGYTKLLKG